MVRVRFPWGWGELQATDVSVERRPLLRREPSVKGLGFRAEEVGL